MFHILIVLSHEQVITFNPSSLIIFIIVPQCPSNTLIHSLLSISHNFTRLSLPPDANVPSVISHRDVTQSECAFEIVFLHVMLFISQILILLSLLADVIISDYNYLFDPISQLKRYFESPDKQYKMIALIDEAHNMVNRSVDMFSSILSSSSFFKALTDLKKIRNKQIMKIYNSLEEYFNYYLEFDFSEQKEFILDSLNIDFVLRLKKYNEEIKKYRLKHKKFKSENVDNFNRDLYRFLLIYDYYIKYKDQYKLFIRSEKEDEITLNMMCLDASKFIVSSLNHFEGSIFFSATLSPIDYYINLIVNNNNNVKTLSLPSPFKKENFKVLVDNSTSFIYKDRLLTIDKIKDYILTFSKKRKGNYMVFCPSYKYLETLKLVLKDDDLIVADVRFQHEIDAIIEKGGFVIKLKSNFKEDKHISESGIEELPESSFKYIFDNSKKDKSILDFAHKVYEDLNVQ